MEDLRVLRVGVSSCIVRVVSLRSLFERKNIRPKQDSPFSNSLIKRSAFNPFPSFTSLHSTPHFLLHQPIFIITQMFPTRISYAFLFLAGVVMAEKKKFNVVSFGRKVEVAVNGGSPVWMEKSYPGQPLHSVELDVESPVEYHYIQDGEKEEFSRQFPTGASSTYNDFFGRQDTVKQYSPLPMPFEDKKNGRWTRGMGQVNIYNETYIPTIHITGPNVMEFFKSPEKFKLGKTQREDKYTAFFISQNEIKLLENVSMTSWGERHPKFCIRMTLGGNDEYFGRNVFKFRYGETDPTFMREKLYTDLLVAVGSPVHQTNIVRVYANGVAIGLYILQDESSDEKFIKTEFYAKGGAPQSMGIPLDADTGADFEWNVQTKSRNKAYDSFMAHASKPGHVNYRSDASNERVVALSHALYMLDPTDEKAVQEFDTKWFDIDIFFKAMAFEYALGHWDSYWGDTSNYALYDDPTESDAPNNYKFYFLDEDFEFTFGSCLSKRFTDDGLDFTKQSYKKLVNREWRGSKEHHPRRRAMIDKLFSTEALTKRFEDILVAIIKHLMNPTVMFGRIDAMYERYREEIRWDRTIPRLRSNTEKNNAWTIDDLKFGINGYPQKNGPHGIDWGLKPFIQERADAVAKEFNFEYDIEPQLPRFIPSQLNDKGSLNDRDVEDIQKADGDMYMSSSAEKSKTSVLTASIIVTSAIMAMTTLIG